MKIKVSIILIVSIILFVYAQYEYDNNTDVFFKKNQHLMIPSAKTLRILSFGNVNLVTDLMYIWAIQFFATRSIKNRFDYAVEIFNVITDLNPKFEPPYHIGSTIIGFMNKKPRAAIALLQKAKKHIKDNYFFDYDSAHFAWFYLKDYKLAKKYYLAMDKYKNLPPILQNYWVYMDMEAANNITNEKRAFKVWKEIEKNAKWVVQKENAKAHLLHLKYKMDKERIEILINKFKAIYKRYPITLNELKINLKLESIPLDYIGNEYKYDNKSGKISLEVEESWKRYLQ